MTGEELNTKYHELCGLEEIENIGGHWMYLDKSLALTAGGRWHSRLPRLDLDANLAIAEADLVFGAYWTVHRYENHFVVRPLELKAFGRLVTKYRVEGGTICEAILKALIAAKERK